MIRPLPREPCLLHARAAAPRVPQAHGGAFCVGLARSGTESLQHALLTLGYDHTYHGWDIIYEQPSYAQQWVKLCRKE